jgi:hypothetical protein
MLSDKSIDFYTSLSTKRTRWLPIKPNTAQVVKFGAEITLQKALALSKLELPVGNWITEELAKNPNLPPNVIDLLRLNIEDEVRHDEALNNIRVVYAVPKAFDAQVELFIKRADFLANLYSPVTISAVLESSIFFVILPMFRFLGGTAMRTTANDISNDEAIHVSTNVQLAKDLGYRKGKALNTFRAEIMDWLVSDLPYLNADSKFLSARFWKDSSSSLYTQGKAESLVDTKRSVLPAFFECNNSNLPMYG